jgi:hypothetical protein
MLRSIAMLFAITFLVSPATALPFSVSPVASVNYGVFEVRMTKSNVCKLKYKHKKAAQDLRENAHCKRRGSEILIDVAVLGNERLG